MYVDALLPIQITLDREEILKAEKCDAEGKKYADVEGIATTEHQDVDGDVIDQASADWDYFLANGKVDWEHGKNPDDIIGFPTKVVKGLSYKGMPATGIGVRLVLSMPKAQQAYNLMKAWADVPGASPIGFSVYGSGRRDPMNPRRLCKARFSRIALTATPVNPFTVASIIKAQGFPVVPDIESLTQEELMTVVVGTFGNTQAARDFARSIFAKALALDGK